MMFIEDYEDLFEIETLIEPGARATLSDATRGFLGAVENAACHLSRAEEALAVLEGDLKDAALTQPPDHLSDDVFKERTLGISYVKAVQALARTARAADIIKPLTEGARRLGWESSICPDGGPEIWLRRRNLEEEYDYK